MVERLSVDILKKLERNLKNNERSKATVDKYLRDVRRFIEFAGEGNRLDKETVIQYKEYLKTEYKVTSANSMLAAVNYFLRFIARVSMKGKDRTVILPMELSRGLKRYVRENSIVSGCIFITRNGKPMDRSNILHAMKKLCSEEEVADTKVFPHNLRHLFAVTFYRAEKDISHLADLLGHSNINTTRIYTLISCEEQERQLDRMGLCVCKKRTA